MIDFAFAGLMFGVFTGGLLVHEFGHYAVAKVYGYRPIFSRRKFAVGVERLTRGRRAIILSGVVVQSVFVFGLTYLFSSFAFLALILTVGLLPVGTADFRELLSGTQQE